MRPTKSVLDLEVKSVKEPDVEPITHKTSCGYRLFFYIDPKDGKLRLQAIPELYYVFPLPFPLNPWYNM